MAQTRMFRDRVVSMEQTLEGGEKHLELLKALCLEAFPDFRYREHALDHERDLFLMVLEAPDGRRKQVGWTRMVLFDAERLPSIAAEPASVLRAKVVEFLRQRASRPDIVVTFRHLEEGWTDTPEPRPARRRRRRGRGAGRPPEKAGPRPSRFAAPAGRGAPADSAPPAAGPGRRAAGDRGRGSGRGPPARLPQTVPASPARARGRGRERARRRRRSPAARDMNFEPTDEQRRIRDAVREFAEAEIAPGVAERERTGKFPREILAKLAEMGVLGMMVPEEYGGAGADALSYVLAIEELSRVCASTAVIVSVNNSVVCYPIWKFGSEEQKKTILSELASGRALGAYALTEPQSGSDAANQKTRAVRDGADYVLEGAKAWITNAGEAKWYVVMAMTEPSRGTHGITAFLVSSEDPGLRVGAPEDKMGLRASRTAAIFLEGVRVPVSRRLGEEGQGFPIAMATLDHSRIGIAAQGIGIARACFDVSVEYARTRETFGRKLAEHEAIAFQIADMKLEDRGGEVADVSRGAALGGPGPAPLEGELHGEGLRDGGRQRDRRAGGADLRRLRLLPGVSGRALLSRRPRDDDLRGHERDPADRHLEEPAGGAMSEEEIPDPDEHAEPPEAAVEPAAPAPDAPAASAKSEASPGPAPGSAGETAAPRGAREAGPHGPARRGGKDEARPALSVEREPLFRDAGGFRLRLEPPDLARLRELPGSRGRADRELGEEFFEKQAERFVQALLEDVTPPAEVRVVVDPYSRQAFLAIDRTIRSILSF